MNFDGAGRRVAGTATDKSGTTDGTAQLVIAANASRLGYQLYNPLSGTLNSGGDKLYVKFASTVSNTGGSWELAAGATFPPPWFPPWNGNVYVFGASGIKFTAEEYT